MKYARPLLITLGIVVLAGAVCLGLLLLPSVQRWLVLRAAAGRPGLKLEVAGVSAGFRSLALRDVRVEKNGLRVRLDRLELDYSLRAVLFSRRLSIRRLSASGIVVDASRLSPATAGVAAAGAPLAAPGLLAQVRLPVELVLADCQVAGRVLLPGAAGQPPVEADYKITGGKFAPGQEGSLLLTATLKNPAADARVAVLNAQASLRATQAADKTFSHVGLTAVVDAAGRNFSEQNQLKISAGLTKDAAGENYAVSVDTLIHGTAEQLLTGRAALSGGQQEYAGQWALKARAAQLEPFMLGRALPDFDARGEGRFGFNPSTRAVSLQGNLDAVVSRLESIEPAWRAIGKARLQTQFDIEETDGVARLSRLDVGLAGEQPVLELHAVQAVELNLKAGRLQVGGAAAGEVMNLKLFGLPLAWVRPFIHAADVSGGMITGRLIVTAEKGRLGLRAAEPLRVDALTVVQAGQLRLNKADVGLDGEAMLTAEEAQASIRAFTLQTPAGDSLRAHGSVTMPLVPDPSYAVAVDYTADLPALLAPWLPLGHVKLVGGADLGLARDKVEVRRFSTVVSGNHDQPFLTAALVRPFSYGVATRRATTGEAGPADLLRLGVGRLPLEHLSVNQPGARLEGMVESGDFLLTADGEKLTLHAASPLKFAGVALRQDGQPALTGLAIEARPLFESSGKSTSSFQTGDVTVRNAAGATLAVGKAETTQAPATGRSATLTFNLEVPALVSQPLFAGAQAVSEGHASGEIRAVFGATRQVEARLTVNGLVARDSGQTLPVANLSYRGVVDENGKISVQAPLLLDRAGQRSDLNFSLELTPAGRTFGLEGKLTGEHVELADAWSVLGVFLASAAPAEAAPVVAETKAVADPRPAWSRFTGRLALDIKSATAGKEWSMSGLTGLVTIDPAQVTLQKLDAVFDEKSRLAAKGDLRFTGGALPYEFAGDFSLSEFDTGKLFKAFEPTRPPTLEGIFTVAGRFTGRGATLEQTLERTHGQFDLTGRQGVFRGLQRTSSKISMTSKAVELGASVLGSILGSDKGTKVAEKVAGTSYFVDQLAQSLGELNYDQFHARLVRGESLNVTLEDLSLVSPEVRLVGQGGITYVEEKPLLGQPLNVSLSFAGRGKTEQLLGKLHLLDGTRDELGYARTPMPVTVGGSLARPDPSSFFLSVGLAKFTEQFAPEN